MTEIRWGCGFTYASYLLSLTYLILGAVIVIFLYHLRYQNKRIAQKVFLFFTFFTCLGHCAFFFLWPAFNTEHACAPWSKGREYDPFLELLSFLPSCLFLTAFTVNSLTFSRIYHSLFNRKLWQFRTLTAILSILNIVAYVVSFVAIALETIRTVDVGRYVLAANSFIVGVSFWGYARLMDSGKRFESQHVLEVDDHPKQGVAQMSRLVIVATCCLCCFTFRSVVDPILLNLHNEGLWSLYFFNVVFAEIVPLCLMLYMFDASPTEEPFSPSPHIGVDPLVPSSPDGPHRLSISADDRGGYHPPMRSSSFSVVTDNISAPAYAPITHAVADSSGVSGDQ